LDQDEAIYTVINGDDIQALAIKEEDLQKVFLWFIKIIFTSLTFESLD
jgi:hypothetical protein